MKALSVRQPWAWAICSGLKRVENRSRRTRHRGPLAIHASLSRKTLAAALPDLPECPDPSALAFGAIVGVVEVVNCVPLAEVAGERFASGPRCWLLRGAVLLPEPIPWRGALGFFDIPINLNNEQRL